MFDTRSLSNQASSKMVEATTAIGNNVASRVTNTVTLYIKKPQAVYSMLYKR